MIQRNIRLDAPGIYLRFPRRSDFGAWSRIRTRDRDHLIPWEPRWPVDANSSREWRMRRGGWIQAWRDGRGYTFLIFDRKTNTLLGGISLTNIRLGSAQTGTLGYWLAETAQGQGHMTNAVDEVCQFGKRAIGLMRIEASTVFENERSQAVLERCGFEREGVAKKYLQIAGTRRDHVLFGKTLILADGIELSDG